MASTKIEYLFCQNVKCSLHVSSVLGKHPADSPVQDGKTCPRCGTGTIEKLELEGPVAVSAGGTHVGTVIPGKPYGGLALQRGDDDTTSTWAGVVQTDPAHQGAHYVAELQHDLLRLGFFGPARTGEPVGKFTLQLMAGVLDLKRHLQQFRGIASTANASQAAATAGTAGAPIHFPPQGLVSPGEALGEASEWAQHLGSSRQSIPLLKNLQKWEKQWTKLNKLGAPVETKAVDKLRTENHQHQEAIKQLTGDWKKAIQLVGALESSLATLRSKRKNDALSDEDLAQLEEKFDTATTQGNAIGNALQPIVDAIRSQDSSIPGASSSKDPGDLQTVVIPDPPASMTLTARFDRVEAHTKDLRAANTNQQTFINHFRPIAFGLKHRIDRLGRDLRDLEKLVGGISDAVEEIRIQAIDSTPVAQLLNQFGSASTSTTSQLLKNARTFTNAWVSEPGNAPGSIDSCQEFMATTISRWNTEGVQTDAAWQKVFDNLDAMKTELATFKREIDRDTAESWDNAYLALLKTFGTLDTSTAHYVKEMVTTGFLAGTPVFRVPMDDEIRLLKNEGKALKGELPGLVDRALPSIGRPPGDAPIQILEFIFVHESGAKHAGKFVGKLFVMLGIDFKNPKTRNATFDEILTPGKQLSFGRGWGASQKTPREEQNAVFLDANGALATYDFHSGLPYPKPGASTLVSPGFIVAEEENMVEGIKVFLDAFKFSAVRRECSFGPQASVHTYDCKNCVKKLKTGPSKKVGGGVLEFDAAKGDFERVPPKKGKSLPLYRIREMDRLRELLNDGFRLEDGRTADQARETDLDEFPCSWLASVTRYAGVSVRGFHYMLEAVHKLQD